jgi:hypothetical protein
MPRDTGAALVPFIGLPREYPDIGVLTLPAGVVAGCDGVIFDRDGTYLIDTNLWFNDYRITPVFGWRKKLAHTRLRGTVLSLLSLWSATNYYHFLIEAIPRIKIFLESGIDWHSVDHVLLPAFSGRSGRDIANLLPIPRGKVRHVAFGEYLFSDILMATSFPGAPCVAPSWAANFLRSLAPSVGSPHRRVYIRRTSARRGLLNEANIEDLLVRRFGFEVFDYRDSGSSELAIMADAAIIVGPHGAGLSRMVFAPPGAHVVEILNPQWLYPFYWSLSQAAGHHYVPLVGSVGGKSLASSPVPTSNFIVDLAQLEESIDAVCSRRSDA